VGIDGVELAGLDQRRQHRPVLRPGVVAREEGVLSVQGQFPFILPMSGRFIVSIIDGMPILART
jgi:hypothetical protein